jgi:hypothetical protein
LFMNYKYKIGTAWDLFFEKITDSPQVINKITQDDFDWTEDSLEQAKKEVKFFLDAECGGFDPDSYKFTPWEPWTQEQWDDPTKKLFKNVKPRI